MRWSSIINHDQPLVIEPLGVWNVVTTIEREVTPSQIEVIKPIATQTVSDI